tara:strand:+ start:16469 stop:16936 length:468 start_codon:yes stop_codon:yes gene_type:complete
MFLKEVIQALKQYEVPYCLIGGYALAMHGIVRATMDVDLAIKLNAKDLLATQEALASIGLDSRLPLQAWEVARFRKEYIEKRNLIAWSFVDFQQPSRLVDILLTKSLSHIKTKEIRFAGEKIKVASLEELLKMKKQSARPQDLVDIERIQEVLNE